MKKGFILSLGMLISGLGFAKEKMLLIGDLPEKPNQLILVQLRNEIGNWAVSDTIYTDSIGTFQHTFHFDTTQQIQLGFSNDSQNELENAFLYSTNGTVNFSSESGNFIADGGKENEVVHEFRMIAEDEKKHFEELTFEYERAIKSEDSIRIQKLELEQSKVAAKINKLKDRFLMKHGKNFATAGLLEEATNRIYFENNSNLDLYARFLPIYENLNNEIARSGAGKKVKHRLNFWNNGKLGDHVSNFSMQTSENETFELESLRGKKLIAITFWHSSYMPSISDLTLISMLTDFYKDAGMQSVSIGLDEWKNQEDYQNVLYTFDLSGVHLIDYKGFESPVAFKFGVETFPQTIFLDDHFNIISRKVMKPEEMMQFIFNQFPEVSPPDFSEPIG